MKLACSVTPYPKISLKWINYLNIRPNIINHLEKNISRTLFDINHSNFFFDLSLTVVKIKAQINKQDLIKLKSIFTAKETIHKEITYRIGRSICD